MDEHCYQEKICIAKHDVIITRFEAMDKAVAARTQDLERRLEGLNQLRQEVIRDRETFLEKKVYDIKTQGYDSWCSDISKRITIIETRSVTWTAAIGLFFVLVQIALHFIK